MMVSDCWLTIQIVFDLNPGICNLISMFICVFSHTCPGPFYKDDDARLGQSAPVGVSAMSSGRTQVTSSFAGGRGVLGSGVGVGGITGLGSSLGVYTTSPSSAQRSVGGVLGSSGGVPGPNAGIYERPRGRSPYR
jgi:hypothetical protein